MIAGVPTTDEFGTNAKTYGSIIRFLTVNGTVWLKLEQGG